MENYGAQPDIMMDDPPEELMVGKAKQVEVAVPELLKEIGQTPKPKSVPKVKTGS